MLADLQQQNLGQRCLDGVAIPSDKVLTAVVTLDPELWRVEHISPDSAMMYPIRQFVHHLGQPSVKYS